MNSPNYGEAYIKNLRNGCAHNNCILANLSANTSRAPQEISSLVSSIKGISKSQRQKKLTCRPILEFVTLLYIYDKIVSEKVKKKGFEKLHSLFSNRMLRNKSYFLNNELVKSTYNFSAKIYRIFISIFENIIDFLCKKIYNNTDNGFIVG